MRRKSEERMATTKEIKNRIKSVRDTQKITNAMYLISSTKVTKAKRELEQTRPYFDMLKEQLVSMIRLADNLKTDYLIASRPDETALEIMDEEGPRGTVGIIVITADKGLCGAYNQNVIKEAGKLIKEGEPHKLFVIGEYGRHYFMAHDDSLDQNFDYSNMDPTMDRAREIGDYVIDEFDEDRVQKLYIVYTAFGNGLTGGAAQSTELLPFAREDYVLDGEDRKKMSEGTEYLPDVVTVFNSIVPSYIKGFIYSAMVESFCSEQSARMTAMDAANDNAEDLLTSLNLEYNHVRQGAITREITEISAGSRAQKKAKALKKVRQK